MSVNIQTGNVVKIQSGNRVLISAPGPQGPPGTGGTPGGSDTQVQFNDNGLFGGNAALTFDKTTGVLSATHIHGALAGNLYVHVKNTSGGTLAKGTPVYATGSVGVSGVIEVAAADYTNSAKMPAIGIIDTALAQNAEGNAVVVGEVTGLATNSYAINQELFVGTSGLLGALPLTGQAQSIAIVSRVHASTGIIVVNAQARLNAALRALANNDGSSLTSITAAQVGALAPDGDGSSLTGITAAQVGALAPDGDGSELVFDVVRLNDFDSETDFRLLISGGSDTLTADRFLSIIVNDSNRFISLAGNLTVTAGGAAVGGTNTGDITLAGTPNYLTLANQVLTRSLINLTSHVTGTLPVANGGTGDTTLTANAVLLGNGTSALQTVAPSTSGNVLTSNGTTWASQGPFTQLKIIDNFLGAVLCNTRIAGAGSAASNGAATHLNRSSAWLQTGTTTTGYAQLIERGSGPPGAWIAGLSALDFCWSMVLSALSDGTNTFTIRAGLETNNFGTVNDGIFFRYTHSTNSGNWQAVTRNSGVETVTNTSVAASTAAYSKFRILTNSAGTNIEFYIEGVLVATHTTNIPAAAGYSIGILKSAGTTNRILHVSPFSYIQTLNTPY